MGESQDSCALEAQFRAMQSRVIKTIDLQVLRHYGRAGLDAAGIKEILAVRLVKIRAAMAAEHCGVLTIESDDIMASPWARLLYEGYLASARLVEATLRITFEDSTEPREVTVREPNVVEVARAGDGPIVEQLLAKTGIRLHSTLPALLLALGLALASALQPLGDDGSDDDDAAENRTVPRTSHIIQSLARRKRNWEEIRGAMIFRT
jgi:hypothetical protein